MQKGKDPAFLFYTSDFLTGTMFMNNEQVGLYIRMLCAQHQHGGRIDTNVLRTQCESITGGGLVYSKFVHDEHGSYNERLEIEIEKRRLKGLKASESVRKRWKKQKSEDVYERNTNVIRSENENENVIEDEIRKRGAGEKTKLRPVDENEVYNYMAEVISKKGLSLNPEVESEKFWNYYTSNGWKVGRNPMKDWQATSRTWINRNSEQNQIKPKQNVKRDSNYYKELEQFIANGGNPREFDTVRGYA